MEYSCSLKEPDTQKVERVEEDRQLEEDDVEGRLLKLISETHLKAGYKLARGKAHIPEIKVMLH